MINLTFSELQLFHSYFSSSNQQPRDNEQQNEEWKWNPFYLEEEDVNVDNHQLLLQASKIRHAIFHSLYFVNISEHKKNFSSVIELAKQHLVKEYESTSFIFQEIMAQCPLYIYKFILDCYTVSSMFQSLSIPFRVYYLQMLLRFICETVARRTLQPSETSETFFHLTTYIQLQSVDYVRELLDAIVHKKSSKFSRLTTEILFFIGHDERFCCFHHPQMQLHKLLSPIIRCIGGFYSCDPGEDEDGNVLQTFWLRTRNLEFSLVKLGTEEQTYSEQPDAHVGLNIPLLHLLAIFNLLNLYELGTNILCHAAILSNNTWLQTRLSAAEWNEFFRNSLEQPHQSFNRRDLSVLSVHSFEQGDLLSNDKYKWWYYGDNEEELVAFVYLIQHLKHVRLDFIKYLYENCPAFNYKCQSVFYSLVQDACFFMCKQTNLYDITHNKNCTSCSPSSHSQYQECGRSDQQLLLLNLLFFANSIKVSLDHDVFDNSRKQFFVIYLILLRPLLFFASPSDKLPFLWLYERFLFNDKFYQPCIWVVFQQIFPKRDFSGWYSINESFISTKIQPRTTFKDMWFVNVVSNYTQICDEFQYNEVAGTDLNMWSITLQQLVHDHELGEAFYSMVAEKEFQSYYKDQQKQILTRETFICKDVLKNILFKMIC